MPQSPAQTLHFSAPPPSSVGTSPSGLALLTTPKGELAAAILAGILLFAGWLSPEPARSTLIWLSLAIGLFHGVRAAWESLRRGRFDIDVLMAVDGSTGPLHVQARRARFVLLRIRVICTAASIRTNAT
jgi:hypothetical protein